MMIVLSLIIIFTQALINLVGALGPELAFDALWYHLTLPKIYLLNHSISYIPGGLFYYSVMPKLTEMLYVSSLVFQGEILAKIIHFLFGILTLLVIYRISRKYLSRPFSLIVCVLFYSNLVVGWQSITAYIDLVRTFFEVLALYFFIEYASNNKFFSLVKSSVGLGLAVSTKILSLTSLFMFIPLVIYLGLAQKKDTGKIIKDIIMFVLLVFLIPFPWFVFSYVNTGSPFYPFLTSVYPISLESSIFNINSILKDYWGIFVNSPDPISPLYLIGLPIIIFAVSKFNQQKKIILIYSFLAVILWLLIPRTGGGRFFLPYLPALSLLIVLSINILKNNLLKSFLIALILLTSISSVIYRGIANAKYLPVILGTETKQEFLKNNLNFSYGDYYDIDSYMKNKIIPKDKVLIVGIHNLYYIDFPFIHDSYVKQDQNYNYILKRDDIVSRSHRGWKLIYKNDISKVALYEKEN